MKPPIPLLALLLLAGCSKPDETTTTTTTETVTTPAPAPAPAPSATTDAASTAPQTETPMGGTAIKPGEAGPP